MAQELIQAVNQMTVSASYLNESYAKKFGFKHYGFDCYGGSTIWSQGFGIVLAKGYDNCYGNFIVVFYPDVKGRGNCIFNYFHLASAPNQAVGAMLNKDSQLGIMGKTGTYATGVHLHTEARVYILGQDKCVSPFLTSHFKKDLNAGWFNPLDVIFCKNTPPDNQSYKTTNDAYINAGDKAAKYLK